MALAGCLVVVVSVVLTAIAVVLLGCLVGIE
jgi:hypothetical protein